MNKLCFSLYVFSCVAGAMLAACGGSQPPIGAPGAMPQGAGIMALESAAAARSVAHRIAPESSYQVLHGFHNHGSGGALPRASLIDLNGILYGTASYGGSGCDGYGCGTVFSVTTAGVEKVLYSFGGGADGANPEAGLINIGGTLYGTTFEGGGSGCSGLGCGTIFSVTRSGTAKVLHSFGGSFDGAYPVAPLTNLNGTLHGTTYGGGSSNCSGGCGTIFSVTTAGAEKVLTASGVAFTETDHPQA